MSIKNAKSGDDMDGDVDFDFFETPRNDVGKNDITHESANEQENKAQTKHSDTDSLTESDSDGSEYSDKSDVETKPKQNVKKIEAKVPVHNQCDDYSDDYDSGSDGEGEGAKSHVKHKDANKKNAWGEDKNDSKRKSSTKKSKSSSYKTDRDLSDSDISTDTDTDSDVTDVSPLSSPKPKHKNAYAINEMSKLGKPPKSPMHKESVAYKKPRPSSAKTNHVKDLLDDDSEQMDLKLLMQAVLEMENSRDREKRREQQRRVLFCPPGPKPQQKLNQTFTNDKVRTIDRENQRLMDKIMGFAKEAERAKQKKRSKPKAPPPKLTPSAVNRNKEQRRIEQENFAMLKRLQGAKATKELRRDQLMTDYNSQLLAGHSIAAVHSMKKKPRSPYEINPKGMPQRSQSATNFRPDFPGAGTFSTGRRSRPSSAKSALSVGGGSHSRPQSAKKNPYDDRPDWESGW